MPLTAGERDAIAKAAQDAMLTIEEMVQTYARKAGAPARFAVGVYDAGGTGANYAAEGSVADRAIAEFKISEADWGDRNYLNTARGKVGVALRTGRNSGDVLRQAPELFQEGEPRFPGAVLGEVGGKAVAVGTSGLRGTEDEPFALLFVELMKRLST
jgi:hypothetical protein